jgi:hypothetical protein
MEVLLRHIFILNHNLNFYIKIKILQLIIVKYQILFLILLCKDFNKRTHDETL